MNTRDNTPKPSDLPADVQAEYRRRRDAVEAGEPTIERDKAFAELQRRARERSSPKPA